jgi:hypothetical protein
MHLALFSTLFDSFGNSLIAIVIPLAVFAVGGVMGFCGMYFHHQQKKLLHETARLALEKGQPIPPEIIAELSDASHLKTADREQPRNDIRAGLILVGVGVGLYMFFAAMSLNSFRFLGTIPGFIGVALLLYGAVAILLRKKSGAPSDHA